MHQSLKPVENGITHAIMASELTKEARLRGDTVIEASPHSPDSVNTVVIELRVADQISSSPSQGSGWTSVLIQVGPGQWTNLVVYDVDVLIDALQQAKRLN